MRESELERILVNEVKKAGGKAYKWVSPGNDGVPDRIVFFPEGKIYFVELKADDGRVRPQQKIQLDALNGFGQYAGVVKGIGGLIEFFRFIGKTDTAYKLEQRYGGDLG